LIVRKILIISESVKKEDVFYVDMILRLERTKVNNLWSSDLVQLQRLVVSVVRKFRCSRMFGCLDILVVSDISDCQSDNEVQKNK